MGYRKMKLSSRSRYGFCAIMELAMHYGEGPLQLKTIAKSGGISGKYLEQLVGMLMRSGLIRSLRGPRGGYVLAMSPKEIKLSDIITTLEGVETIPGCIDHQKFSTGCGDCVMSTIWTKLKKTMSDLLESITLQDLVDLAEGKKQDI